MVLDEISQTSGLCLNTTITIVPANRKNGRTPANIWSKSWMKSPRTLDAGDASSDWSGMPRASATRFRRSSLTMSLATGTTAPCQSV